MRICLLTTGQPSTNPRLVKEADALAEAGYEVHVLCAYWASWAAETDRGLLGSRPWSCAYVGGQTDRDTLRYAWTRFRHRASRRWAALLPETAFLRRWALCRALPELERAARRTPANLYIAHYPGALVAAAAAARRQQARLGFDAEDFHTGQGAPGAARSALDALTQRAEARHLPECDYLTAASPGIADAYAARYGLPRPTPILNVFPLSDRPPALMPSEEGGPLSLYWFSQTIGEDRGLEDVVRAMGSLGGYGVELHLRGSWQPGYRERLLRLAASVGADPERIVAHPPAPPGEMVRLAASYDVGLALEQAVSENRVICLTNKIFTYLLAGNAVIATATRGQKPVMERIDGAGVCYAPGDVEALARALRAWCEDRPSLQKARRQAWEWGTREYNWDLEKHKLLGVVEDVLGRPAGRVA